MVSIYGWIRRTLLWDEIYGTTESREKNTLSIKYMNTTWLDRTKYTKSQELILLGYKWFTIWVRLSFTLKSASAYSFVIKLITLRMSLHLPLSEEKNTLKIRASLRLRFEIIYTG